MNREPSHDQRNGPTGTDPRGNSSELRRVKTPRERVMPPVVYQLPGMDEVRIHANLNYTTAGNPNLLMDVYVPPAASPDTQPPMVIFIHGAAGAEFKPKDWGIFQSWGRLIAAAGMVAVCFTHRLGYPKPLFDEAASDVRAALAFVRANAASWHADPDRIGIIAWSGGGPLLSIALQEKFPFVRCLLAFYALLDAQSFEPFVQNESADTLKNFSPVAEIKSNAAAMLPIFVARAGQDELPAVNESIARFAASALAANAPLTLMNHPDGEHGFDNQNDDARSREIIRTAIHFLHAHLD